MKRQKKLLKNSTLFLLVGAMTVQSMTALGTCTALAEESSEYSDFAVVMEEEFAEVESEYMPEIRWWLAEGSHTDETLIASVQELYDGGFRGIEILTLTESSLDQSVYGWGSEEWNHDTQVILEEANRLGMKVSFTSGPNWQPAIMGITPDDTMEAMQEIEYRAQVVNAGESYSGNIMLENCDYTQNLIAVYAAKLNSGEFQAEDAVNELDFESMEVLTDQVIVDESGTYSIEYTAPEDGTYVLLAYWMHGTGQGGSSSAEPSYVVSHFTKEGAESFMKYWDENVFTAELQELIQENGNVNFFQDSLEINVPGNTGVIFTSEIIQEFQERRGYDLTPYIPVLRNDGDMNFVADTVSCDFTYTDMQEVIDRVNQDYAQTLTELYEEYYLTPIKEWLNQYGIALRAQVSYGQNLELSDPVQYVDYPEMETLFMNDEVDGYRTQAGVAHLYEKNVISSETGAVAGGAYRCSLQDYLKQIHTQYAGGVNRTILHGYSNITGPDESTEWPGYEGIGFMWSERWGSRMPYWTDIQEFTMYLGRLQEVLRAGVQKMDVAILNLNYDLPNFMGFEDGTKIWTDLTLEESGYTYEFVSPLVLTDTDTVAFENGVLAEDGPAYQAVVVFQEKLPYESAEALLALAQEGLPVVLVEGAAVSTGSYDQKDEALAEIIEEMTQLSNVQTAADEADAARALEELGISPRLAYSESSENLSVLREEEDIAYLYTYNPTEDQEAVEYIYEGVGTVYELNAWSGDVEIVESTVREDGKTSFVVDLEAENAKVYLINKEEASEVDASKVSVDDDTSSESIHLTSWDLSAEIWMAGDKVEVSEEREGHTTNEYYYTTKKETVEVSLDELVSWNEIPELGENAAGIGTYSTSFTLPEDYAAENTKAVLSLGDFLGSVCVYVNGNKTEAVNLITGKADISDELIAGDNTIEVRVTTTLGNAIDREVELPPMIASAATGKASYGLLGEVEILLNTNN